MARLQHLAHSGEYAYYVDFAAFIAGTAPAHPSDTRRVDGEPATRQRWQALVTARRHYLRTTR